MNHPEVNSKSRMARLASVLDTDEKKQAHAERIISHAATQDEDVCRWRLPQGVRAENATVATACDVFLKFDASARFCSHCGRPISVIGDTENDEPDTVDAHDGPAYTPDKVMRMIGRAVASAKITEGPAS